MEYVKETWPRPAFFVWHSVGGFACFCSLVGHCRLRGLLFLFSAVQSTYMIISRRRGLVRQMIAFFIFSALRRIIRFCPSSLEECASFARNLFFLLLLPPPPLLCLNYSVQVERGFFFSNHTFQSIRIWICAWRTIENSLQQRKMVYWTPAVAMGRRKNRSSRSRKRNWISSW